jgi:putative transposase
MIDVSAQGISVRRQCQLLALHRSRIYYKQVVKADDTLLANLIAEIYTKYPVYGYRRIRACLSRQGYPLNGKHVLRLMRQMGIRAIYPQPRTTIIDKAHPQAPYLLKDMKVVKPHQAWQIDITYLKTEHGFMYMNALIDVFSRYVVGWSLSNNVDTESCLRTVEQAVSEHGRPEMINSDQGSQFTSYDWVSTLHKHGITISMSGKGRSNDNAHIERLWRTLKYEWAIINGARTVSDYKRLLPEFFNGTMN